MFKIRTVFCDQSLFIIFIADKKLSYSLQGNIARDL